MSAKSYSEVEIKRILVPIDGSDDSWKAAAYGIRIAKLSDARLVFLHAVPIPYYTSQFAGGLLLRQKYQEEAKKFADSLISSAKDMATKAGIKMVESEVLYDVVSIPDSIVNYAARSNVDLIIMGSKGLTGIKKFVLGSVAEGVVSHASCPVLVVKEKA